MIKLHHKKFANPLLQPFISMYPPFFCKTKRLGKSYLFSRSRADLSGEANLRYYCMSILGGLFRLLKEFTRNFKFYILGSTNRVNKQGISEDSSLYTALRLREAK